MTDEDFPGRPTYPSPEYFKELDRRTGASEESQTENPQQYAGEDELPPHPSEEPAASVGGTALDASATKMPVSYEDTIHGPEGDSDPATQQWREENWVDEDTARARTEAEKENRDLAADSRGVANILEEFQLAPTVEDRRVGSHYVAYSGELDTHNTRLLYEEMKQNPHFDHLKDGNWNHDRRHLANDTVHAKRHGEVPLGIEKFSDRAEKADAEASRLADWAEILHKNPPTEAFIKDRTPDWEAITPQDLVEIENNIKWDLQRAQREETSLPRLEEEMKFLLEKRAEYSMDGKNFSMVYRLSHAIPELVSAGSEEETQYIEMANDDDATVKDFKNLYDKICKSRAESIRKTAGLQQKFLDDIKSGAAASHSGSSEVAST